MKTDEFFDQLNELLESATPLPLTGGRVIIDAEKLNDLLAQLRDSYENDIRDAKALAADRVMILQTAKRDADAMLKSAKDKADAMISKDEILVKAQKQAQAEYADCQRSIKELRSSAWKYIDDMLKKSEEEMSAALLEVRKVRMDFKSSMK